MANQSITKLYKDTLTDIIQDSIIWKDFLKCASMNSKRPFNEQVLIYAQRPDAIGCTTMQEWNLNYKRWIIKGSKAIKIITEKDGTPITELLFNANDTRNKFGHLMLSKYYV